MNFYIYYDVAVADAASTADAVRAMQTMLGLGPSDAKLLRRADTGGERQTWMEVYENMTEDFDTRLAAAVVAHGLSARTGARHVERFMPIA